MSLDDQGTKWRRNIAENFNRLSSEHERYRRQTDDGRQHVANVNSCSLKTIGKHREVAEEPLYTYTSEGLMDVAAPYRGTPGAKFTKFVE